MKLYIRLLRVDNEHRTHYGIWNGRREVSGTVEVTRFNLPSDIYTEKQAAMIDLCRQACSNGKPAKIDELQLVAKLTELVEQR